MSKTLIIAEKPSVATDLARVLGKLPEIGKLEKKKDYFENDNAYVGSAIGHLVELKMPTTAEGKKLPWGIKHLPVIPDEFILQPIERSEARFKLLVRLLKKKDVTTVVNACDAGREGELIFQYLLKHAGVSPEKFEIKRMWMQSMTDGAIIEAWNEMRSNDDMQNLTDAAMCRSESDWLIGLNGTRALTAFNSRNGGFNVTTAGRVQTPTLMILAEREREIRAFVPRTYFEVHGQFSIEKGDYAGRWFVEDFKKDETDEHKKAERIWTQQEAEAVKSRCEGKQGVVEETRKPSKQAPPLLFDLTSLQREANSKHGFPANRTLQLAQACYDKYKILTYPRTDSKCLPEDYVDTVKETIANLAAGAASNGLDADLKACCSWIIKNDRVQPVKRVFNTKKVSDHFAIIPTGKLPPKLDDGAFKIYQLVLKRFLAIFYPSAEFEVTRRITRVGDDTFRTDGKVLVVPGYLEVYGRKPGVAAEKDELTQATDGETANVEDVETIEKETRPPARYTDSTLLSAMETAGKRVDDDELREAMSERGLGTPATRAATIEGLIRQKYLFRNEIRKSELVVSNKGLALSDLLDTIGIKELGSPEMTGEWEYKLKAMEQGELNRDQFMNEIKEMTNSIVTQTKDYVEVLVNRKFPDIDAKCPECGGASHTQTDGLFQCKNPECIFKLKKHIASHELTETEAIELIEKGKVGPIETFKNRFGQPFAAELTLAKPKKVYKVSFVFEGDEERANEVANLKDEQIICQCKLKDDNDELTNVYETERAFLAPAIAKDKNENGTRISKTILQKDIPTDQGIKLFVDGKTELMPGFISKKGRKFSAHLTLDRKTGKLGFEFAPRKAKGKKGETDKEKDGEAEVKVKVKKASTKKKTTAKKATTKKKAAKKKAK